MQLSKMPSFFLNSAGIEHKSWYEQHLHIMKIIQRYLKWVRLKTSVIELMTLLR